MMNRPLHIVYPTRCCACNAFIKSGQVFCDTCKKDIKAIKGKVCKVCFNHKEYCNCRKTPKWYRRCLAPFEYSGAIKNAALNLKTLPRADVAAFAAEHIAKEIAKRFSTYDFDYIVPVPLHFLDKAKRGYNQSLLIAKALSDITGIKVNRRVLYKKRRRKPQHMLKGKERVVNAKGAYAVRKGISATRVLLVDDIITGGSTVNECAKMLRLAGAKEVYVCSFAKTM